MPDLTEAVEAAARAAHGPGWENALPMLQHSWRERLTPIIGAAYEPIRAAVIAELGADLTHPPTTGPKPPCMVWSAAERRQCTDSECVTPCLSCARAAMVEAESRAEMGGGAE